jgi:beta-aspartyl-peptidase (threonine type)
MTESRYSLMLHGGAGALKSPNTDDKTYLEHIKAVLESGREKLQAGMSAIESVAHCASLLEDDELFNAGKGSVLNEQGRVEMDAAIMDGKTVQAGSVAAVSNIRNPIQLATRVMWESEHVMLIGEGAMQFAAKLGLARQTDEYFHTENRLVQWKEARKRNLIGLDHDIKQYAPEAADEKLGTIGAIAMDVDGNLAAATSTGGVVNKRFGRIGDSPLIGCGVFADNETCAVSCTGYGEDFIRTVLAKYASDLVLLRRLNAHQAVQGTMDYLRRKVDGRGGMILIDNKGFCASGFTTEKMIRGWIEHGGKTRVQISS